MWQFNLKKPRGALQKCHRRGIKAQIVSFCIFRAWPQSSCMRIHESPQSSPYGWHSDIQMPSGCSHAAMPPCRSRFNEGLNLHTQARDLFRSTVNTLVGATATRGSYRAEPLRSLYSDHSSCHNTQWPSLFFWRSYCA